MTTPTCPRCGAPKRVRVGKQTKQGISTHLYCPCGNAAAVKSYKARHPERTKAHRKVQKAKRRGKLQPQPCEQCGATPTVAHHEDYASPLKVTWLCHKHHHQRHKQIKRERIPTTTLRQMALPL